MEQITLQSEASLLFRGTYQEYRQFIDHQSKKVSRYQCTKVTQSGQRCKKVAYSEGGVCAFHGGPGYLESAYVGSVMFEGVYVFRTKRKVLYVGKSVDVVGRISQHLTPNSFTSPFDRKKAALYQECMDNGDFVIEVWRTDQSALFEQHFIKRYNPQLNIQLTKQETHSA